MRLHGATLVLFTRSEGVNINRARLTAVSRLIGHRLLGCNVAVGDARWRRTDDPGWWFIVANHRMTFARLAGRTLPGDAG